MRVRGKSLIKRLKALLLMARLVPCLVLLSLLGGSGASRAQEAATPTVDFTNVTSAVYNADNRNSRGGDVSRELDDEWGMLYNRLNAQGASGNWRFSARIDGAWFYASRSPLDVSLALLHRQRQDQTTYTDQELDLFVNKFFEAGNERSTRFTDWLYPAKYSVTYAQPGFDVAVGDFYAQFGRGLVLSVRKQDELSSDTTIRGVRLGLQSKYNGLRLKFSGVAGSLNPLRLDASSGRYLGVANQDLPFLHQLTEAGMPRSVSSDFVPDPQPTYQSDMVVGAELEVRHALGKVSVQGAHFDRACLGATEKCGTLSSDLVRTSPAITQGGVAFEAPNLWDHAAVYVEYAHQTLASTQHESERPASDRRGYALYASLDVSAPSFAGSLEAKHVRGYQTVTAGIDTGRVPEFNPVVYNVVPTTEPVWNDTQFENFGACVTGGRARGDVDVGQQLGLFAWVAHYQTWGELGPTECDTTDANRTVVWDFAQGVEARFDAGKSSANFTVGTRFDDAAQPFTTPSGDATSVFYRELYLRYDVVQWIGGDNALQFQGWHRRRRQTLGGPELAWLQGLTTTALQVGRAWNFAVGIEYDQNPAFPAAYFNGQVRYNFASSDNLTLFVGQQQGGLRCVSGICRVFPPFEGARLDATIRF